MRPKFKGDTFYIPTPEGVYFRNNQNTNFLKGKKIYQWLELIVPYLDGNSTLEEITSDLPPERQTMINNLVNGLLSIGAVKDISEDQPHTLTLEEEEIYASEIAFIDSFCDSAAYRFEQFRNCRILLIGSGLTYTSLVQATFQSGIRQITIVETAECLSDQQQLRKSLHTFQWRDPQQSLISLSFSQWDCEAEIQMVLSPFDVVIHVSDHPMLARTRTLNRICLAQKKVFIQALTLNDKTWIGPLVDPSSASCWECGWLRLQDNREDEPSQHSRYDFQDLPTLPLSNFIAIPGAAIVANHLCFEIFKHITAIQPLETAESFLEFDLETLESHKHSFFLHPLCSSCQHPTILTKEELLATIHQLEQGEPLDLDTCYARAIACIERSTGVFSMLDEHDFIQLPLHISQATLSRSIAVQHHQKPLTAIGVGMEVSIARRRAMQRACELYAVTQVDQRRFLHPTKEQKIDCNAFGKSSSFAEAGEWTWAYALDTGQACLIPAMLVYPTLSGEIPSRGITPGLNSGMTWAEAVCNALLAQCKHMTIMHIDTYKSTYSRVDIAALPSDTTRSHNLHMLELSHTILTIYDVTGVLGIPTFAFCLATTTVAYSSHLDPLQALQEGLEVAVQYNQAMMNKQPQYLPPEVPDLSLAHQGAKLVVPSKQGPENWLDRQRWLVQRLQEFSLRALVVPLHHDPALHTILPYIVATVLTDVSSEEERDTRED
jgi:putative thiazole-containing bacteriocin maturation protein